MEFFSKYMDLTLVNLFFQMFLSCLDQIILSSKVDILFVYVNRKPTLKLNIFTSILRKSFWDKILNRVKPKYLEKI